MSFVHTQTMRMRGGCTPHYNRRRIERWRSSSRGDTKRCAANTMSHYLADNGECQMWVLNATEMVNKASDIHETSPTGSSALGRVLMGTLLVAASKGAEQHLQVTFKGDGPVGQIMAIAQDGFVKGRIENPEARVPLKGNGNLDVGTAIGKGVVTVIRKTKTLEQFTGGQQMGITSIVNGEIAEDLANYLADSEQINSALALGVQISPESKVEAAGGYLLQVLPNVSESTLKTLESNVNAMPSISGLIQEVSPEGVASKVFNNLPFSAAGTPQSVDYGPCENIKDRMLTTLKRLGQAEVNDILAQEGQVEMTCDFCKETISFSRSDLVEASVL